MLLKIHEINNGQTKSDAKRQKLKRQT